MNIIKVNNKNLVLNNKVCKIEYLVDDLNLEINGNVCIYDKGENNSLKLNIKVNKNSTLTYYMYSINSFGTKIINIDNLDKSKTLFNYSFISDKDCKLEINNNILGNDINSNIRVRAVANDKSNITIDSNGYVKKNTLNNVFNEDLRGLNKDDGMTRIYPNMFIDTDDVVANHNSTIGNINNDYLFYLNSKGIDNKIAQSLIVSGFINSILDNEMKDYLRR